MSKLEELKALLQASQRVVALTGAGISTESGIPDFRSQTGIYNTVTRPLMFSPWFIRWFPDRWYKTLAPMYRTIRKAVPNAGHRALKRLELAGKRVDIVTQNIDGLHQAAGSTFVHQVHGRLDRMRCMKCGDCCALTPQHSATVSKTGKAPRCRCGGALRPDIVMFGELLPEEPMRLSKLAMLEADVILVLGTSLCVSTGLNLLRYRVEGTPVVVINRDSTAADEFADIVIHDSIGETLAQAV